MPRLEKVAEQYENQPSVLFLSLNIDDDPGFIDPFLKEHKLTFPVLPAYDYAADTLKVASIPQNWIVGPDGIVRLKGTGYDATEKWEQGMKEAIEKCKSQASGPDARTTPSTTPPCPDCSPCISPSCYDGRLMSAIALRP